MMSMTSDRVVSSMNNEISSSSGLTGEIMSGRSLMWIINAMGPILLPWGTPPLTRASCENSLRNLVTCDLPLRYDPSQEIRAGLTPIFSKFSNSLL